MHNKHQLQDWNRLFTFLYILWSMTLHLSICACSLWQLPFSIWIKSPVGQRIAWKFPCFKVGEKLWQHQSEFMRLTGDTGRLRGALLCQRSKDHWGVKEKKKGGPVNAKRRQWKYLRQFKIKKETEKGEKEEGESEQGSKHRRGSYLANLKMSWYLLCHISRGGKANISHFGFVSPACKLGRQITAVMRTQIMSDPLTLLCNKTEFQLHCAHHLTP